jgi:aminopeptidase N
MEKRFFLLILLVGLSSSAWAQSTFTRQDTLRGTLSPLRSCYDVQHYDLHVKVIPTAKRIEGRNTIRYRVVNSFTRLQLDLFNNLTISRISSGNKPLKFQREGHAVFVDFPTKQTAGTTGTLTVEYAGAPVVAKNAPWDGGFDWRENLNDKPWVTVACEGIGASLWWPCKDHLSDEPDSMRITLAVPKGLMGVSNGNLRRRALRPDGFEAFEWAVTYPINNYNVTLNVGDYVNLKDEYVAADGDKLALDYYVFRYHADRAKEHFTQVKPMLTAYEKYLGKYPFWRDGYALVETPYWGMEHQGAIAYGNFFRNLPIYGFDFIIIHESGHEYFGNAVSCVDHAELWIHEAFTTYLEFLYLEHTKSYDVALKYLVGQRAKIKNKFPMLGPLGVNYPQPDADIYYKGSWMLHTLRHVVANDSLWFGTLRGFYERFRYRSVTSEEVMAYFSQSTGQDLGPIFREYLRSAQPPVLEYRGVDNPKKYKLSYRWVAQEPGFAMPVQVTFDGKTYETLRPTRQWQTITLKKEDGQRFQVAQDRFYVRVLQSPVE